MTWQVVNMNVIVRYLTTATKIIKWWAKHTIIE